ncbi:MAG: exonuclease domain-containing protein [Kiritimatiellae bacterium]|nr:exonuclease domain-containing protein [Kiritimatiellia bacterium]
MEKQPSKTPAYIWFDSEFTSLDPREAHLLQVAMIITDTSLQRILPPECDVRLAVRLPENAPVSTWVQDHIPQLVAQARSETAPDAETIDRLLVDRIKQAIGEIPSDLALRPILAGNSIHADRSVIRRRLPLLAASLHYRMLDVSTWKIAWLDHFNGVPFPKDQPEAILACGVAPAETMAGGEHDAYYDVCASIAEYRYYLSRLTLIAAKTE